MLTLCRRHCRKEKSSPAGAYSRLRWQVGSSRPGVGVNEPSSFSPETVFSSPLGRSVGLPCPGVWLPQREGPRGPCGSGRDRDIQGHRDVPRVRAAPGLAPLAVLLTSPCRCSGLCPGLRTDFFLLGNFTFRSSLLWLTLRRALPQVVRSGQLFLAPIPTVFALFFCAPMASQLNERAPLALPLPFFYVAAANERRGGRFPEMGLEPP